MSKILLSDKTEKLVLICKKGGDSKKAALNRLIKNDLIVKVCDENDCGYYLTVKGSVLLKELKKLGF